jgi:hypothetical protein
MQEDNNTLRLRWSDRPDEIYRAGNGYLGSMANENTRTPAGHPEGYIEAFANIYRNFARCIYALRKGKNQKRNGGTSPVLKMVSVAWHLSKMYLASSASDQKWTPFKVEY